MNKDNNKNRIAISLVCGGAIGIIIGIITVLGQRNDNFVYMYAAPYYIYFKIFDGGGSESIPISVYYCLIGLCIGYFWTIINPPKNRLIIILSIVFSHIILTAVGLRTISKDLKEFFNTKAAEMIVDAISGKDKQ